MAQHHADLVTAEHVPLAVVALLRQSESVGVWVVRDDQSGALGVGVFLRLIEGPLLFGVREHDGGEVRVRLRLAGHRVHGRVVEELECLLHPLAAHAVHRCGVDSAVA